MSDWAEVDAVLPIDLWLAAGYRLAARGEETPSVRELVAIAAACRNSPTRSVPAALGRFYLVDGPQGAKLVYQATGAPP